MGSRQTDLLAQMCEWDNLMLACQNESRGKRGYADVAPFEHRLADNCCNCTMNGTTEPAESFAGSTSTSLHAA